MDIEVKKHSIFIVEDEAILAMDLKLNLERIGYSILGSAPSGEKALAELEKIKPDLVIMDIKLQGTMDGIDTAAILNKRYGIPFIILSACSDDGIIERAKYVDPYAYIIKPFGVNNLRVSIEMAMHRAKMKKELAKLEMQLRQSEKMKTVGDLAGGIAHDFNNILTVILGYASLAGEKIAHGENIIDDIDGIRASVLRAKSLTKHLLAFSRDQILNPEFVEVDSIVNNISRMISRIIPENILLSVLTDAANQVVYVDQSQIEQVLLNFVLNAKDAMPEGGSLIIRSHTVCLEKKMIATTGSIPKGNYIVISVKDNGTGISPEDFEHIFDPFFTTKPIHKGTGLGLSTAYGVIKQSEGYIDVASKKDVGTTFSIYFESAKNTELKTKKKKEISLENFEGTETILVVEDEDEIRKLIIKMLNSNGYQTIESSNPGEAILLSENKNMLFDLLIADIFMPLMNGKQLSERLHSMERKFKTVFISGYNSKVVKDMGVNIGSDAFLAKPFRWEDLLLLVRHTLDAHYN